MIAPLRAAGAGGAMTTTMAGQGLAQLAGGPRCIVLSASNDSRAVRAHRGARLRRRPIRRHHRARPRHRRHGGPLVRGRRRHPRRPHRRHRPARPGARQAAHRCRGPGGGAGLHRHAGQSELTILVDPHVPSKIFQGITTEITGEGELGRSRERGDRAGERRGVPSTTASPATGPTSPAISRGWSGRASASISPPTSARRPCARW